MTGVAKFFLGERRLLIWVLAISCAAHVAAFYVFTVTDTVKVTGLASRPSVGWMPPRALGGPGGLELHYAVADALDPSLMSLPSARGFSGKMWDKGVAAAYRGDEWSVEPDFLDVQGPGTIPDLLPRTPLMDLVQSATREYVPETEEPAETFEPPVPVNQSVVRITGPLEGRAFVWSPELPTVTSVNPLRPTRIRVAVSGDGVVRYALIERSSGDEPADARALDLVRQFRFEPLRDSDTRVLTWGVVRFLWATEPPATAGTNAGSARP